MSTDGQFRLWMGLLAAVIALAILTAGCGSLPFKDAGPDAKSVAETIAPVEVTASDEAEVTVDATTTTEAEALASGAVKAETARDIRTFGLDPGTLSLLKDALAGFWRNILIAFLVGSLVVCVGVAASIGGVMVGLVLPVPEMGAHTKAIWWVVGTALIAGPISSLFTMFLWKLSQLAGG